MDINELIKHPNRMDSDTLYELRSVLALYPYFQTARLLMLQNLYLLHDPAFDEELRKAAIYITDRNVVFNLIEAAHYKIRGEKKVETVPTGENRTVALIDSFLESIPKNTEEEKTKRKPTPADAAVDYVAYLLETEGFDEEEQQNAPQMKGQELIDDFINKEDGKFNLKDEPEYLPEIAYQTPYFDRPEMREAEDAVPTDESVTPIDTTPTVEMIVEPADAAEKMIDEPADVAEEMAAETAEASAEEIVEAAETATEEIVEAAETATEEVMEQAEASTEEVAVQPAEPSATVMNVQPADGPTKEMIEEQSEFTETLARIYIKQGRFDKALTILEKIKAESKGKTYFDDQIRFLRKLVINNAAKK